MKINARASKRSGIWCDSNSNGLALATFHERPNFRFPHICQLLLLLLPSSLRRAPLSKMRLSCIQFPEPNSDRRGQVHDVPVRDVYRLALAKTANIEPARLSRINTRRPRHSETLPLLLPPLHHHRLHLRLHLRCLPPPLYQFIHASNSPHPRPSGPIQLPLVTPVVVFSATFSPTRRRADRADPLCLSSYRVVSLPPPRSSSVSIQRRIEIVLDTRATVHSTSNVRFAIGAKQMVPPRMIRSSLN